MDNPQIEKYLRNISRTATMVRLVIWVAILIGLFFVWDRWSAGNERAALRHSIERLEQTLREQIDRLRGDGDR